MKLRTDFVTNSSSSSFILGFKDKEDIGAFVEKCIVTNNSDLIPIVIEANTYNNEDRDIKERLFEMCSRDITEEVYEELHPGYKDLYIMEKIEVQRKLRDSQEFKDVLFEKVSKTKKYIETMQKLSDMETVLYRTIWDLDGGEIESKIRDDLLRDTFSDWLIIQEDIG